MKGELLLFFLHLCQPLTLESKYSKARRLRTLSGHGVAQHLYSEILSLNPTDSTAATRLAAHPSTLIRHSKLGSGSSTQNLEFTRKLREMNFNSDAIAHLILKERSEIGKASSAPLYLQPLRAGSNPPPLPKCSLSTCIQLFIMAACLPVETCKRNLGEDMLVIMEATGVAFQDDGWVVPYCHIMPVTCRKKILYFATDLHPNVLSTTTIGDDDEGAVMYIGPDSLALLDHWNSRQQPTSDSASIVDIGSGSGIQALSLSSILSDGTSLNVTSIDINSRALNLTKLNFEWNGFPMPKLVLGDITEPYGRSYETNEKLSWESIFGEPTIILANPPFLPVPVEDPIISKRYGLFSSGGASGDIILERIIRFASRTLSESSGTLAIVSEFINPESEFPEKFRQWWGYSNAQSVFFSNQEAMDADTYARRRADSSSEVDQWRDHLNQEGITDISPGLLFVKKQKSLSENNEINFSHYLVPKTEQGSIWTPTNLKAREFTKTILETTWGQILTTEGQ